MLMPKKLKFRKMHRGTMKGQSKGAREVLFGEYGLQAMTPAWMTAQQIEAIRVTMSRKLKKGGKLFLRDKAGAGMSRPAEPASCIRREEST